MHMLLLYIDNAVYNVTGQTTYSWNSQQVDDGSHTIKVVATDEAGNAGQAQVTVATTNIQTNYISRITALNKSNASLQQQVTQLQYVVIGIIIALAVVATLSYIFLRRKTSVPPQI